MEICRQISPCTPSCCSAGCPGLWIQPSLMPHLPAFFSVSQNRQQIPEKSQKKKKKTKWRGDRATGSHKLQCVILWWDTLGVPWTPPCSPPAPRPAQARSCSSMLVPTRPRGPSGSPRWLRLGGGGSEGPDPPGQGLHIRASVGAVRMGAGRDQQDLNSQTPPAPSRGLRDVY